MLFYFYAPAKFAPTSGTKRKSIAHIIRSSEHCLSPSPKARSR